MKIAKEKSRTREESGVKRSLYKRIRMERARNPNNLSMQVGSSSGHSTNSKISKLPFNNRDKTNSIESRREGKYDIKKLEDKIKALDYEIYGTKGNHYATNANRSCSITTNESKLEAEIKLVDTVIPNRVSFEPNTRIIIGKFSGINYAKQFASVVKVRF